VIFAGVAVSNKAFDFATKPAEQGDGVLNSRHNQKRTQTAPFEACALFFSGANKV
jgi:hypothetical protein